MLLSYLNHVKLRPCPWLLNTTFIIPRPPDWGDPSDGEPRARRTHGIWFSCSISSLLLRREGRLKWQQNNARPADWLIRLHLELIKCGVTRKESTLLIIPAAGARQKKNRWWYASFFLASNLNEAREIRADGHFSLGRNGSRIGPRMMKRGGVGGAWKGERWELEIFQT